MGDLEALLKAGNIYLIQFKYPQAIDWFTQALKLDQNSDQAYILRGKAYYHDDQYRLCYNDSARAKKILMKQNPDLYPNSRQQIDQWFKRQGKALYKLKKFQRLKILLEKLIREVSDSNVLLWATEKLAEFAPDFEKFAKLNCKALVPGEKWYLVSKSWYRKWELFAKVTPGAVEPGPITSADICKSLSPADWYLDPESKSTHYALLPDVQECKDFEFVAQEAFWWLKTKYETKDTFSRYVICLNQDLYTIETILMTINIAIIPPVFESTDTCHIKKIQISRKYTASTLGKVIERWIQDEQTSKEASNFNLFKYRLWKISNEDFAKIVLPITEDDTFVPGLQIFMGNSILEDAKITDEDIVIVEFSKQDSITWILSNKSIEKCCNCGIALPVLEKYPSTCQICYKPKYCNDSCRVKAAYRHQQIWKGSSLTHQILREDFVPRKGQVGLQNLGNTCYMNAALQCMSSMDDLSRYFLNTDYTEQINENNPIGSGGRVATAYAKLLDQLWSESKKIVAAWDLKKTIQRIATQFSGYSQHDSQEFLGFLLDGIHEDLNQVTSKPYLDTVEGFGRLDSEAADESWNNHLARNRSLIVDLMHGQIKSTLVCPTCKHTSVTYDPFLTYSVPLIKKEQTPITINFIYYNPMQLPNELQLQACQTDNIELLCEQVADNVNLGPENFQIFLVQDSRFIHQPDSAMKLHKVGNRKLFAFELPPDPQYCIAIPLNVCCISLVSRNTILTSYPRIIFLKSLAINLYEIHYEVFRVLARHVLKHPNDFKQARTMFELMTAAKGLPYTLRITTNCDESNNITCAFCGNDRCSNCTLPIDKGIKFSTYIAEAEMICLEVLFHKGFHLPDLDICQSWTQRPSQFTRVSLDSILRTAQNPEQLDENNEWYCSKCSKLVQAMKTYQIYKLPKYLIIHLKRFRHRTYWTDKLSTFVDFPLKKLDMSPYTLSNDGKPAYYDLHGITNHYGTIGAGHYTAYVRNGKRWLEYDDSKVTDMAKEQVVTEAAYILFYKRKDNTILT